MDFDGRVWPLSGGWGRYTRLVSAVSWLPNILLALSAASSNLSGGGPGCGNRTEERTDNYTGGLSCWLEETIVTQWDLVQDNEWKVPLAQICYLIGWLFGYIIFGCVSDRCGRRNAFISALVVALPLGVALCFSPGFLTFLPLQAGFGAALAGIFLSLYIARLELCLPGRRLMITMIAGFFWLSGELLLPGLALLCGDWKILQGAITGLLALLMNYWCCRWLFPESPRWAPGYTAGQSVEGGAVSVRQS
ncbi:unnamed protein product [Staurois parvus]|uniref:Major facilitator superfamily (MFS) profile domain-containing protein n=1 Tax=Staurois parvus TaxID=386267 RepID=A0ABN9DBT7_9NEOB|nr:unnamed protein product [Staurois parvus]